VSCGEQKKSISIIPGSSCHKSQEDRAQIVAPSFDFFSLLVIVETWMRNIWLEMAVFEQL
jgi:hypothetical protein